ncbi:MAG: TonB-dependent receptor [Sphingobium sp.]
MLKRTKVLLTSVAMMPGFAMAQMATGQDEFAEGGDIIVTAQRYEQRLQDVPISITAITAKELQARNVSSIGELQYSVPGFSTYKYGAGQEFYQLQGVSNTLGSSTVGLYLDETPLALDRQGNGLGVQLIDMQRVEVLRGPQATLYGEGSMGGTIRYIPIEPDLGGFSGSVAGQISATENGEAGYRAEGVLNLPLALDKTGIRLVAGYEHVGGWINSAATGKSDVNGADLLSLRGTVVSELSDRVTVSFLAQYQETDQNYQDFGFGRITYAALPTEISDKYALVQGKAGVDLEFAELTAIGSYIRRDNLVVADLTPFYLPFLGLFGVPAGAVDQVANTNDYNYDVYSGELRLTSQSSGAFRWMAGATYREVNLDLLSDSYTAPLNVPFTLLRVDERSNAKTYAAYGELSYSFAEKLKLTAGLRYYEQKLTRATDSISLGAPSVDRNKGSFDSLNPRFNVSYTISPNSMIFANVAKGFRGGGFNLQSSGGGVFAVPASYQPDKIWTYEIGTKQQLFDRKLALELDVYHSKWSDVQSYGFAPGSPIVIITNSGRVSGWGVDVSATARPVRGLTLTGTYGWNNLEFDEATGDKAVGDPVDGAVRESYSASAEYRAPVGGAAYGFIRGDFQHAGPAQITFRNFGQIVDRPSRDLVNFRIGADIENFQVALFVNNLFDEDKPNIIGPFGVFAENLEQAPRTMGVSARITF